ncbi:MAG: alpha/beta fold hydrolase [Aureispira sp.]
MPKVTVNGVELYYNEVGTGKETLVFSHGYLMNHTMFDQQVAAFKDRFRCIAFEHRGHAQSQVTKDGYEMDNLVLDAICLIEKLELGPVHFTGMSTGGFVGMRIALRRPDLLKSLILMDTSADAENPKALPRYRQMLWVFKYLGSFPVMRQVIPLMFHQSFIKDKSRQAELKEWKRIVRKQDRKAMVPFGEGIFTRKGVLDQLATLDIPTAIIVGEYDRATPPKFSQRMADVIPNAQHFVIPDAGHSAAIEMPQKVNAAMEQFYAAINLL